MPPGVEPAVRPIIDEIADQEDQQHLKPFGQREDWAVAARMVARSKERPSSRKGGAMERRTANCVSGLETSGVKNQ